MLLVEDLTNDDFFCGWLGNAKESLKNIYGKLKTASSVDLSERVHGQLVVGFVRFLSPKI